MPSGPNTSQAWAILNSGTQAAATFGAGLDNNAAIASQNGGSLYVYQQNPASLSVNVDVGFALWQAGAGLLLQGGGSPVAVTLTLPSAGQNPQYATIYWDQQADTVGVQYGVQAVTPVPIFPESQTQIPLAVVFLAFGMTNLQANSITDVRQLVVGNGYLAQGNNAFGAAGWIINAMGVTDLWVRINVTAGAGLLQIQNLEWFTRINLLLENSSGAARTVFLECTTPGGNPITTKQTDRYAGTAQNWNTTTSFSVSQHEFPMNAFWSRSQAVLIFS